MPERGNSTDTIAPEAIHEHPPASKLVYVTLELKGPLSPPEIARTAPLPHQTVLDSLERLEAVGVVEGGSPFQFGQSTEYRIAEP